MKRLAAVCVLSVLVSACDGQSPLPRPAPSSPGTTVSDVSVRFTLSGTVTNSMGVPIEGARVEVLTLPVYDPETGKNGNTYVGSGYTDSSGRFVVVGLEPGSFLVEVSKDGFQPWSGSVTVDGDMTASVMLVQ